MSQPSVTAYFNTRKRQATDDIRGKSKVLLLERDQTRPVSSQNRNPPSKDSSESSGSLTPVQEEKTMGTSPKIVLVPGGGRASKPNPAVRNIQFDSPKKNAQKTPKSNAKARVTRSRKLSGQEGQPDIRESFQKIAGDLDAKRVLFEKKGTLSPKKKPPGTPKKTDAPNENAATNLPSDQSAVSCTTPKKSSMMERLAKQELSFNDVKNRITKSARLMELKASISRFKNCEQRLEKAQKRDDDKKIQIQKFEKIQLEIPVSPQKAFKSPSNAVLSPVKNKDLMGGSPQRRILFEPKEKTPSPVKSSPTKAPAYQQYLSLAESGTPALPLPYHYRFLAEAFRCVDTVSAMLFNRKEIITFKKLKPAVQELLRKNFTLEHVAQIKTMFPDAYAYHQEKHRTFGSTSKQDKYELVLRPIVKEKDGRTTPDSDDVLKSQSEVSMGPRVLLDRRRTFYNILLGKVKDEHEKFLLALETPMRVPKEKILRWHPEFDVESCKEIEKAELPQPPNVEKLTTAKDVLDKAKSLFSCGTRMEKALQRLAEAKASNPSSPRKNEDNSTQTEDGMRKVNITVVDTPPATPTTQNSYLSVAFKGLPKALLEKVRARQAAKAFEAMTRTPNADKEAAMYSRLPELGKILRNIFVAEKKSVLTMEFVIGKLENSFRAKLIPAELEEHIRLLCKLMPVWTSIHNVRKVDYLKMQKDVDLGKVVRRLEVMANNKVTSS